MWHEPRNNHKDKQKHKQKRLFNRKIIKVLILLNSAGLEMKQTSNVSIKRKGKTTIVNIFLMRVIVNWKIR